MAKERKPAVGKDADLSTAFKLTERLMTPSGQTSSSPPDAPTATETLGQNVRYWLWRAGGRKRPALNDPIQVARLLDNYEVESERREKAHAAELVKQRALHDEDLARLRAAQDGEGARLRAEAKQDAARDLDDMQRELAKECARTAELERLTNELMRAHEHELARSRAEGVAEGDAALAKAIERVAELERRLGQKDSDHGEALARVRAEMAAAAEAIKTGHAAEQARMAAESARLIDLVDGHERDLALLRREATEQAALAAATHEGAAAVERDQRALAAAQARIAKLDRERKSAEARHAKELAALREEISAQSARARAEGMAVADSALCKAADRAAEAEQVAQSLRAELAGSGNAELAEARRRIVELSREVHGRAAERDGEIGRMRSEQANLERELAAARGRIAEMELGKSRKPTRNAELEADLAAALARGTLAEDALRVANNKVELLKDALEGAKARAVLPGPGPVAAADPRFREAKRAFARQFHPDQGGRDDPQRERLFMEFWPVLEKIDREG